VAMLAVQRRRERLPLPSVWARALLWTRVVSKGEDGSMSKLVDELLQAADAVPWESAQTSSALANRLRQRAAWVRELEARYTLCPPQPPLRGAGAVNQYRPCGQCAACVVAALTDPDIPAAIPCAGCLPAEGDYGDGEPPMVLGRHVEGCGTAQIEREEP